MKNDLETYLNDHLAGSAGGLMLAKRLAETATDPAEKLFFHGLKDKISDDRETLESVIRKAGYQVGTVGQMIGSTLARAGIWRMNMNGLEIGDLGRFELIELLAIGIHGKSLLWRTLHEISDFHPEWNGDDFDKLERSAVCQSLSIEVYRGTEAMFLFGNLNAEEVTR